MKGILSTLSTIKEFLFGNQSRLNFTPETEHYLYEDARHLTKVVQDRFPEAIIVIFGSVGRGESTPHDIDLMVFIPDDEYMLLPELPQPGYEYGAARAAWTKFAALFIGLENDVDYSFYPVDLICLPQSFFCDTRMRVEFQGRQRDKYFLENVFGKVFSVYLNGYIQKTNFRLFCEFFNLDYSELEDLDS
jgi:hypothetical protein